jgi:tetratricopeptide (TPR) repeat protein
MPLNRFGQATSAILLLLLLSIYFKVLEEVANGQLGKLSDVKWFDKEQFGAVFKLIISSGLLFFLVNKIDPQLNSAFSYLLVALIVFSIPASCIILSMEKTWFSQINPVKIIYLIKLLGKNYIIIFLILFSGFLYFFHFVLDFSQSEALLFLNYTIVNYLFLVSFAMMGYLIFQHQFELNYRARRKRISIENKSANENNKSGDNSEQWQTEVDVYVQEGRFEDAIKILLKVTKSHEFDYAAYEKLILLYAFADNQSHLEYIANEYFSKLIENNKRQQILVFYKKLQSNATFTPSEIETVKELVALLHSRFDYGLALELLDRVGCKPNDNPQWDWMALQKAKINFEFLNEYSRANDIVNTVLKRGMNQKLLSEAEAYLQLIAKSNE